VVCENPKRKRKRKKDHLLLGSYCAVWDVRVRREEQKRESERKRLYWAKKKGRRAEKKQLTKTRATTKETSGLPLRLFPLHPSSSSIFPSSSPLPPPLPDNNHPSSSSSVGNDNDTDNDNDDNDDGDNDDDDNDDDDDVDDDNNRLGFLFLKTLVGRVNRIVNQTHEPVPPVGDSEHGITGKMMPASLVSLFGCLIYQVPEPYTLDNDSVFVDLGSGMGLPCFAAGCLDIRASIGFELSSLIVRTSIGILKKIHTANEIFLKAPVYFVHKNLTNISSLEGATHLWCFSEGMGLEEHEHILRLCVMSTLLKVLAIACRDTTPFKAFDLMSDDFPPYCQFQVGLQKTKRTCRIFLFDEEVRRRMRRHFLISPSAEAEIPLSFQLALHRSTDKGEYEKWLKEDDVLW